MGDPYLRPPGEFAFPGPIGTLVLGADHGAQALLGTAPCEVPIPLGDRCQQLPGSPNDCGVSVSHAGASEMTSSHSGSLKFETREVEEAFRAFHDSFCRSGISLPEKLIIT